MAERVGPVKSFGRAHVLGGQFFDQFPGLQPAVAAGGRLPLIVDQGIAFLYQVVKFFIWVQFDGRQRTRFDLRPAFGFELLKGVNGLQGRLSFTFAHLMQDPGSQGVQQQFVYLRAVAAVLNLHLQGIKNRVKLAHADKG